jgi:carbonic anhydrase
MIFTLHKVSLPHHDSNGFPMASLLRASTASSPARPLGAAASLPLLFTLAACTAAPPASAPPAPPATTAAAGHATWSYVGSTGPEHWGDLSPEWSSCSQGARQSPIDLATPSTEAGPALGLEWGVVDYDTDDEGHGVHVEVEGPATLTLDGAAFDLLQFHAHTPSEHTIAGRAADAEVHFVHQADDGRLAVVGVLVERGAENSAWSEVVDHIEAREHDAEADETGEGPLDLGTLLPAGLERVSYVGSLTTPPCTEGVTWVVLTEPVQLSAAQIDVLRDGHDSARPVQPLGDRVLTGAASAG